MLVQQYLDNPLTRTSESSGRGGLIDPMRHGLNSGMRWHLAPLPATVVCEGGKRMAELVLRGCGLG